jgi:hypothetical protein
MNKLVNQPFLILFLGMTFVLAGVLLHVMSKFEIIQWIFITVGVVFEIFAIIIFVKTYNNKQIK